MAKISLAVGSPALNVMLLIILGLLASDAVINPLGLRDLLALRRDRVQLEAARDRLIAENTERAVTVVRLRGDDNYIQRLIHQELGYVRRDELIYRFPDRSDSEDNSASVSPAPVK